MTTTAAITAAVLTASAASASAHALHVGDDPTNWLSTVQSVTPSRPGLHVGLGDGSQRLIITVTGPVTVVVAGYAGEPYLRLTDAGTYVNTRSSTTYDVAGPGIQPPLDVNDKAAPRWHRVSPGGSYAWHDARTHWPGFALPPPVQEHPDRRQHVLTWNVPLRVDGHPGLITGQLVWVPAPGAGWAAVIGVLSLCGAVALGLVRRRRWPVAAALIAVAVTVSAHEGLTAAARVGGAWTKLAALPGHGIVDGLLLAAYVVAAVGVTRRREWALFVAAMLTATTFLGQVAPSLGVLWHSQAVDAAPLPVARLLVAGAGGTSLGLLAAVVLLIRRKPPDRTVTGTPTRPLVAA
jgi:hypothetical protein